LIQDTTNTKNIDIFLSTCIYIYVCVCVCVCVCSRFEVFTAVLKSFRRLLTVFVSPKVFRKNNLVTIEMPRQQLPEGTEENHQNLNEVSRGSSEIREYSPRLSPLGQPFRKSVMFLLKKLV
jgi:hypothetical protein